MRVVLMASVGVLAVAALPAIAFAVDYMSADQAAQAMFPDADRFEAKQINLDAAQMAKLESLGVRARSARWAVKAAQRDRKSTRLNSSHLRLSRMPSSA